MLAGCVSAPRPLVVPDVPYEEEEPEPLFNTLCTYIPMGTPAEYQACLIKT